MSMPKLFLICICLIAFNFPVPAWEMKQISCYWAFLYNTGEEWKTIAPAETKTLLTAGDKIKIFFKPDLQSYVYIYYYDTRDNLHLLFPDNFNYFDHNYRTGHTSFLPNSANHYTLDQDKGIEQFFY